MYFEDYGWEKEGMRLYSKLEKNASVCASCSAPCLGQLSARDPDPGAHDRSARDAHAVLIGAANRNRPRRNSDAQALAPGSLLVLALAGPAAAQSEGGERRGRRATTGAPPWALPPPSACSPPGGLAGWPPGEDAAGVPFQPGDSFQLSQLETLKNFVPPELWTYRERFFHEGMRLEIGACFADYGPPEFYRAATETFRGRARLLPNGGIENYTAGQPFPMLEIAPR